MSKINSTQINAEDLVKSVADRLYKLNNLNRFQTTSTISVIS